MVRRAALGAKWMCTSKRRDGGRCNNYRGERTVHFGHGACWAHSDGVEKEVWSRVYEVAKRLNVTPWEALIDSVKLAAGRVAWVDAKLAEIVRQHDGAVDTEETRNWLKESRNERTLYARIAKAAIDAGVSERMVRQIELEGQLVAEALTAALDILGLTHDQRMLALHAAHNKLSGGTVVPGQIIPGAIEPYGQSFPANADEVDDSDGPGA